LRSGSSGRRRRRDLIDGAADLLRSLRYAEIIRRAIRHAELHVIPDAGHASCWERPDEFNRVVLEFLARQPAGASCHM
jgi:pimeloyl-ACP methyl ester carboxylesterase